MYRLSLSTGSVNLLEVVVDSTNPARTSVECMFEPRYNCTIDYGTDSSYTNLVYSDNSITHDRMTIITLSQEIQRNTNYYFIVSALSSSQCERVRGTFRTGECINCGVQLTHRWKKKRGRAYIRLLSLGALQFFLYYNVWLVRMTYKHSNYTSMIAVICWPKCIILMLKSP